MSIGYHVNLEFGILKSFHDGFATDKTTRLQSVTSRNSTVDPKSEMNVFNCIHTVHVFIRFLKIWISILVFYDQNFYHVF